DVLAKPRRLIEVLTHAGEALLVDAFEADREADAAAPRREVEELGVARDVDRRLRRPFYFERDHRAEELFRLLGVRDRVVVEEEDAVTAVTLDRAEIRHHVVDRPRAIRALVVRLHRAVLTGMRTAAREDHWPMEVHAIERAR